MELKETLQNLDKAPWTVVPRNASSSDVPVLDLADVRTEAASRGWARSCAAPA